MSVAQVESADAQRVVVRAGIERQGDPPAGADTGGGGVDGQLSCRYLDAADGPVADARDVRGIAANDDVDVAGAQAKAGKGLLDVAGPVDRQVDLARAVRLLSARPSRLAGHRVRDDGQQLGRVVGQHLEIERLVAVAELLEADLPADLPRPSPNPDAHPLSLL